MQCKGIDIALPHTWSLAGVLAATYSCRVPDCCPNKWRVFLHGRRSICKTLSLVAKTVATGRGEGLVYSPAPQGGAGEPGGQASSVAYRWWRDTSSSITRILCESRCTSSLRWLFCTGAHSKISHHDQPQLGCGDCKSCITPCFLPLKAVSLGEYA